MSTAATWVAEPELIIATAGSVADQWRQALLNSTDSPVCLDLSAVTELDSAGLQLLAATRRELAEQGRELLLQHPSRAVRDGLACFGWTHWLN
jgi:anti-sigma B factor antagonist